MDPKQFLGLDAVADAVEYLHSGKSVGKVCISSKKKMFFFLLRLKMIIVAAQIAQKCFYLQ